MTLPVFGQTTFSVGDWVSWVSQAQGTWLKKTGEIVAVIPANVPYWKWRNNTDFDQADYILHTDLGSTMRKEISYLVAVPSKSGKGKPHLYWPRTWALTKVELE